ncbi:MAG: hypothetical protein QXJ15_04165 [Candidatus Bathyarchaeia archaeon]
MRAIFFLTPSESNRLIAKAVAQLPKVKRALAEGRVIGHGSTNVYSAEEIFGECPKRNQSLSGLTINETLLPLPSPRSRR